MRLIVLLLLALTACPLAGCGGPGIDLPANILLVTLDTTRTERLGCYGHDRAATPTLEQLASTGVVFDSAAAHAPLTLPSHASVMTGLYPPTHGVRGNGIYALDDEYTTLAETLSDAGYQTGATVASFVLDRRYGLAQGFDRYDDDRSQMKESRYYDPSRDADAVTRAALDIAADFDRDRPFFLWAHYFDPHAPYEPPADTAGLGDDAYDGEIAAMDRGIRDLLDGLDLDGRASETWVIVIADHGEGLGDPHDEMTHGSFLYDDTVRVPFLITRIGREALPSPGRSDRLVRQIDVMPTILDLLAIEPLEPMQGRSLKALVLDAEARGGAAADSLEPDDFSYAETLVNWDTYGWSPLYQLRNQRFKYIAAPVPEFYDLQADPKEQDNIAAQQPERVERFRAVLDELVSSGTVDGSNPALLNGEEDIQRLAELGYVVTQAAATAAPGPDDLADLKDPKEWIDLALEIADARELRNQGKLQAAVDKLQQIRERDPDNLEVNAILGRFLLDLGQLDACEAVTRHLVELRPDTNDYRYRLGLVLSRIATEQLRADKMAEALQILNAVTATERIDPRPFHLLGTLCNQVGSPEKAVAPLRRAVALDPTRHDNAYQLAFALYRTRQFDEAKQSLQRAIDLARDDGNARSQYLGILVQFHRELKEWDRAKTRLEQLLREHPDDPRAADYRAMLKDVSRRVGG